MHSLSLFDRAEKSFSKTRYMGKEWPYSTSWTAKFVFITDWQESNIEQGKIKSTHAGLIPSLSYRS